MKKDIKSLSLDEILTWIQANELPAYRAKQIYEWLHKYGVADFSEMSSI